MLPRYQPRTVGRPLAAIVLSFFGLTGQALALEAVYVSNFGSSTVSAYTVDSATGALTPAGAPVAAGNTPFSITVTPDGKFAYVVDRDSNNILAFAIDSATGALTPLPGFPPATGTTPFSVTVSPSGAFAYVANSGSGDVSTYSINSATGILTAVGSPVAAGTTPFSIAVSPNGAFAYVANSGSGDVSAYAIDSSTGALTPVSGSPFAAGTSPFSVTVSPNGAFAYVSNSGSGDISVFAIDSATGALTPVGSPVAAGTSPGLITLSPNGAFAYVTDSASANVSAFAVDSATGALTPVSGSPFTAGGSPYTVAVSRSGAFAYAANAGAGSVSAYTINSATGALTPVSGAPFATGLSPFTLTTANLPGAPTANTGAASGISATAATLGGTVSANGAPTTVNFEYGLTTGYGAPGSPAAATQNPVSSFASGTAVSAAISGLSCNTTYHYRVTATNGVGSQFNGSDTTFVTAPCVPDAPTAANATAGNGQATVTFSAPGSDGGSAITGYTVISNPAGGTDTNAGSTSTSHVITGLTNGAAYTFTVVASNSAGSGTPSAASNSVTPSALPGAPSAVSATAGNGQASVSFTAPADNGGSPITGYTVVSSPAGGVDSNAGSTGTSHVITGLSNGVSYTFTVQATNANGSGTVSGPSNSVTPSAPASGPGPTPTPDPQPTISPLPGSDPNRAPVLDMNSGSGPTVLPGVVTQLSGALGSSLGLVGQNSNGAVIVSGPIGTLAFTPVAFQTGDTRQSGVYPAGNGQYVVVNNGSALTIIPAVAALDQLVNLLPGSPITVNDRGNIIANLGGTIYSVQPDVFVTQGQGGAAQVFIGNDGIPRFIDASGNTQKLNPAFADTGAVQNAARSLDVNAQVTVELDGSITLVLGSQRYHLVPDLTLGSVPANTQGQSFWQEGGNRFRLTNGQPAGTTQGFTVK